LAPAWGLLDVKVHHNHHGYTGVDNARGLMKNLKMATSGIWISLQESTFIFTGSKPF